jgi:hypothetical protein
MIETSDDFFFSEMGMSQRDLTSQENVHQTYWDHYFNEDFSLSGSSLPGEKRFNFKLQKRYPT